MNPLHLHLMTAHLPVVGLPFAAVVMAAGLIGRSDVLWRAGAWALVAATALTALPYFSGPAAYELAAERSGVAEGPAERHAVVARAASLGLVLLGGLTVSVLLRDRAGEPAGRRTRGAVLAAALLIAYGFAWAAHLGGSVRRPELLEAPTKLFPSFR